MPPGRVAGGCAAAGVITSGRKTSASTPRAPASVPHDRSAGPAADSIGEAAFMTVLRRP